MKIMTNGKMGAIDIALIRLDHVPFVVTNNRKMAVWTDVKEIMLWCPSPQCSVVLDALKLILGYPAYERAMHPCSQLEQLMFLKHFMFVRHGTLLVDIDSLRDGAKLALLYNMVREKHTRPNCQTVFNCTKMLKTFTDKYANTSFKIPLSSASAKNLLPAVRRISKNVTCVQIPTNSQTSEKGCSRSHDLPTTIDNDGGEVAEQNRPLAFPQTAPEGNISRTLVPLALLCKLYPGCEGFLDEVVRLYVLGQCEDKNLQSVCQCTVEEGIQLTRFLASQNGYEKFWLCLTTCSLMMSWLEFWHGYDRMCRGGIDVMAGNVCVVSLNCQTTEMRQNEKVIVNKKKTTAPWKQTLPTQPSPSLSTINDITANVQSQNRSGPLATLSEKYQSLLLEDTAYCKCDQNFEADNKIMSFEKVVPSDETEVTVESSSRENEIVTDESDECKDNDDAKKLGNERQSLLAVKEIKGSGKRGKKKLNGSDESRTSIRQGNKEVDGPKTDDKAVSELNNSEKTTPYKTRRKGKKVKVGKDVTELGTASKGIKSRLRSRNKEGRIIATDERSIISKEDANNSAMLNAMSSSLSRSGLGDSNNSESKSVEMAETADQSAGQATEVNKPRSLSSQYTPVKIELPMSEVSPYDLTSMKYHQMAGIHVSITSKKALEYILTDNIPGEISPDLPLSEKRNIDKKKVDNLQSIRNRRELMKISSAQIQDEIPVSFKYIPNSPTVKANSSPTAEQACSVARNRGKFGTKTGPGSQDEEKLVKANKLEYISLTPKQLELTGPMLRCPDPGKVQRSKTIPYKPVKATEETARKNRTETVINRPRTDPVSVVLEGKPYQHNTTINSCKLGLSSADEQRDSFESPTVEPCIYSVSPSKTGILHEEIVYNLQKQAVNSFSVSGNQDEEQLAAEGKAVKHCDRTKDLNSSDFLKERITMWKNEVEQSLNQSSPGRLSKSADLVRRRNICTYRPRSSIYSSRFTQSDPRGPLIKTALCSLYSRDRASPNMFDEQIHFQTSANETNAMQDSEKLKCEYSNNYMSSFTPIASKGRRSGQIKLDYQYDVQNYGSSSSVTPDIYDEFARKRKPKSLRPEIVKIKPKPVTTPFPTTTSQPIVRKQQQFNLQMSRKPSYHTVGYMSGAEISKREKEESSSYINQDIKQMYRYTNTLPSQNLPHYSQTKVSNSPQQIDSISNNPRTFCLQKDTKMTGSDENQDLGEDEKLFEHQCCQTAGEVHVAQSSPHEVVSSSSVKADGKDKSVVQINRDASREDSFPPLSQTIKLDKNTHVDCLQGYEKGDKYKKKLATEDAFIATTCNTAERKNNYSSAMNKLSSFLDCIVTPGKVESLEYINSLQALTGASTLCSWPVTNCDHLELTELTRKCQSEVNTTKTENRNYGTKSSSQQTAINSQRSKSELRQEKNKLFDPRPKEHILSKVDTQLYYTVPGDDRFHPVSENTMIPRYAQFFVQTDETESVKGKQLFLDQDNRLEQDLSVVATNGNESGDQYSRKETKTNDGIENLHAEANLNEEEKLSSTTFDSIIKASEDFIDRSRLIKHVISTTKQAIERTESDEDDLSHANQTEVPEVNAYVAEQIEERDEEDYPKVIMPSAGQTVENQSTGRKKSFKEIIEEKREEKRKIQLDLSRKKYWNSAHAKKDGNIYLSIDNKFYKQRNGDQSDKGRAKGYPKQKNESLKHEAKIDKQKIKQQGNQRHINSKFVVTSQRRPKTCIGFGKGRTTKDISSTGRKRIKDIPNLNAKSHTNFAAKQKHDRIGTINRSKYQQPTKSATIFPRSKNSNSELPKESDDCTSKILTALRRLSIEKSPKTAEQKGSSKQEVRQNKLRDCVVQQIPLGRLVNTSHTDTANDPESKMTILMKDSSDLNEVHDYENKDEVEHVCKEQNTQVSKIPVLIGMRKDIHDDVPEEYENCVERNEDIECFADLQDFTVQRQSHNVTEQVDYEISEYENNMQKDKSESDINQEAVLNKETFITLYGTKELALYRSGAASEKSTSDSSVDFSQLNEEKYLGIPYFQDANSNMNNVEYKVPVVNLETTNCSRSDENLLEKGTGLMTELTNEELYNMNFFPNKIVDVNNNDHFVQIPTVSTTSIRSGENQDQQDFNLVYDLSSKAESSTKGIQHLGADLKSYADNIFQGDQALFQDMPFVKQGILGSKNAEQLTGNCQDPNWLHITFSQNIVGNPEDGYYFTQADAKQGNNDTFNSEERGKHQGYENFTYVAYDILKAMDEHSDHGINIIDNIKMPSFSNESNTENGSNLYTCETEPYQHDQLVGTDENLTNIYFCEPVIPGSLMQQADVEVVDNTDSDTYLKENTEGVDRHSEDPIYEDWDHCYQVEDSADKCQEQGQHDENLYIEANYLNDCDNGDYFLDETDCGQEVYIGDDETDGRDIPDLENGLFNLSESELVNNIVTTRKSTSEISVDNNSKDNYERDINSLEKLSCLLKENNDTEKSPKEQKEGKEVNCSLNKDINKIAQGERKKSVCRAKKKKKIIQKPKKEKTKFVVRSELGKSENVKTVDKYTPSQSEVEAYFKEVSKRTGIEDIRMAKNKKEDNKKITKNYDSDTDSKSEDSLPEFSQDFSITGVCVNKNEHNESAENDSVTTEDNQDGDNEQLRLDNDDEANEGDIDDDDEEDDNGGYNEDDDDDDDYNPETDLKEFEEYSDYSVSDDETCENENSDNIDKTRRNSLKKANTSTKVNKGQIDFAFKKNCRVSLEKVRSSFQKKYNIKNSSAIHEWKMKSQKADKKHGQKMGSKISTSNRQSKEKENSVVREFCLKNSHKNNDTPDKRESDIDIYLENIMKSHSYKIQIGTESTANTSLINSSDPNRRLKETIDAKGSKEENDDNYKVLQTDYKSVQQTKKKKRGKKSMKDDAQDENGNSEDGKRKQKEENMAAEGFIKTQKRYYEILRNSAVGTDREDTEVSDEQSVKESAVDELSEVIEAVPVHGERVITKALSDAEKALEGTGSLEDIHNEDEGAVIEDLINQCSYQMIEDEDHVQLGGVAHFKDFALPFVYINGYKYTPLRDTLTIFTPECCVSACTIPRSVLQKHKAIVKTFSTWEQVYKLELIKMKKGPAIMTGDMLIKLDTLLTLLPELIQQIVELHIGTKLKRSKKCDISAYKILKSKFM